MPRRRALGPTFSVDARSPVHDSEREYEMKSNTLTPAQSAWLAATFKRNRDLYGGMTMELDDDKDKKSDDDTGKKDDDKKSEKTDDKKETESGKDDDFKSEHSKQSVLADLATVREANKKLESELAGFKTGLAEALGIKPDDKDKDADVLATVQQQLAAMQHESTVLKLANEHGISDKDDLELLGTAKDQDSMKKLAERLAPSENDGDEKKGKRPKPDRSQGGGGEDSKGSAGGSVKQVMADRAAARAAKNNS